MNNLIICVADAVSRDGTVLVRTYAYEKYPLSSSLSLWISQNLLPELPKNNERHFGRIVVRVHRRLRFFVKDSFGDLTRPQFLTHAKNRTCVSGEPRHRNERQKM